MDREPIRIRLVPRKPARDARNAREGFWSAIHQGDEKDQDIDAAEGKLCREFGPALRQLLISQFAAPIRSLQDTIFPDDFRIFERFIYRGFPRSEKDSDQAAPILDSLTRLIAQRQQFLQDSPGIRRLQEKIAVAGSVNFTVRIAAYSSLDLDLSIGSLKSVAEAFDNDFDSFRVFLEAFAPQAFGNVFSEETADSADFTVQVPVSYKTAFTTAPQDNPSPPETATAKTNSPPNSTTRERAEWLWRLANGSLLVPVLIALFVMYQGMSVLKEIHTSQSEAMKPILDHELKLLEEDRRRLFKEPVSAQAPPAAQTTPTK
jgi:hypothetical protein